MRKLAPERGDLLMENNCIYRQVKVTLLKESDGNGDGESPVLHPES